MGYGERYLEVKYFIDYCKKLNVQTSENELEYYEQTGMMLPTARVIVPEEYVRRSFENQYIKKDTGPFPDEWNAIERLVSPRLFLPQDWAQLKDEKLIEAIDHEFDNNPYLFKPNQESFKPWKSYSITVQYLGGHPAHRSIADHYYSYWQVHHLFRIQQYPELYKYQGVFAAITDEKKRAIFDESLKYSRMYSGFSEFAKLYDALSYFMTIYHRERMRSFAQVPARDRIQKLEGQKYGEYRDRMAKHGAAVAMLYSLSEDHLFDFIIKLIRIINNYEKDERFKLVSQVENDIIMIATWLMTTTTKDWEGIVDEIGKRTDGFIRKKFSHLDTYSKMKDVATDELNFYAQHYHGDLKKLDITNSTLNFSTSDVDQLIHYCDRIGLDMLAFTFDEMIAMVPLDDVANKEIERKFQRTNRYTNFKNLATTLEYLLRGLVKDSNYKRPKSLTLLVLECMKGERWFAIFSDRFNTGWTKSNGNHPNEFYRKLSLILEDKQLTASEDGFWARSFLIACLARNLSVHTYPTDDWFYGDLMGEMVQAIVYCFLYSWYVAKREKWVDP